MCIRLHFICIIWFGLTTPIDDSFPRCVFSGRAAAEMGAAQENGWNRAARMFCRMVAPSQRWRRSYRETVASTNLSFERDAWSKNRWLFIWLPYVYVAASTVEKRSCCVGILSPKTAMISTSPKDQQVSAGPQHGRADKSRRPTVASVSVDRHRRKKATSKRCLSDHTGRPPDHSFQGVAFDPKWRFFWSEPWRKWRKIRRNYGNLWDFALDILFKTKTDKTDGTWGAWDRIQDEN